MKRFFFLLLPMLLAAVVTSCIEDVELYPQEEREIVLSCVLENKDTQELLLYYALPIREAVAGQSEQITDAEIELYHHASGIGSDSSMVGKFIQDKGEKWTLKYRPEPGSDYSIVVKTSDKRLYAKTHMPDTLYQQILKSVNTSLWWAISYSSDIYGPPQLTIRVREASTIWAYCVNERGEMEPEIWTNHPDADAFNATGRQKEFIFRSLADIKSGKEQLVYYNYHDKIIRFHHSPDFARNYLTEPIDSSMYPITDSAMGPPFIGNDGNVWGPVFYVQPSNNTDGRLVLMNVSKEYDEYLKFMISKSLEQREDYSNLFSISPLRSTIENGMGVFGAVFVTDSFLYRYKSSYIVPLW